MYVLRWMLLWLAAGFGLRIYSALNYPSYASPLGWVEWLSGMANDLQSFVLVAGLVALGGLVGQRALRGMLVLLVAVAMIVFVAEVFFWVEFESRMDRLVFHYLAYPKEVVTFLEEQFYVTLFLLPFLAIVWLVVSWVGWPDYTGRTRANCCAVVCLMLLVLLFGKPVGGSSSRLASEFASNGYLGVMTDARFDVVDIAWLANAQEAYPVSNIPVVSALGEAVQSEIGNKKHIILIVEESFAGPTWADEKLRQQYLPNFNELATRSLEFTRLFATGSRTTRGLEAILNGFVPLPGISTTERDEYRRLPSLARAMEKGGLYPAFLYGGWPGFSNFSNFWVDMGFRRIWTRDDFDEDFETSWGVSDQALFNRLLEEMSALTELQDRVFLSTLTVSHHRPYDFPDNAVDFPADARRSAYAMAYADHALGEFMQRASQMPWYDDTLFLIVADHGPLPRGDEAIPVGSYRIPLLIHGSGVTPRKISTLGSSMSIPTTLTRLLGIDSTEAFAGEDLLCDCDSIVPVEFGYEVGLLGQAGLSVLDDVGQLRQWRYDPKLNRLEQLDSPSASELSDMPEQRQVRAVFGSALRWYYQAD